MSVDRIADDKVLEGLDLTNDQREQLVKLATDPNASRDFFGQFGNYFGGKKVEVNATSIWFMKIMSWLELVVYAILFTVFAILVSVQYTTSGNSATYNLWTKITWYMGDYAYISQSFRAAVILPAAWFCALFIAIANLVHYNNAKCHNQPQHDPPPIFFNMLDGIGTAVIGCALLWLVFMETGITAVDACVFGMMAYAASIFLMQMANHSAHSADKHYDASQKIAKGLYAMLTGTYAGLGTDDDLDEKIQLAKQRAFASFFIATQSPGYATSPKFEAARKAVLTSEQHEAALDLVKKYYNDKIRSSEKMPNNKAAIYREKMNGYTWSAWACAVLIQAALATMLIFVMTKTFKNLTRIQDATPVVMLITWFAHALWQAILLGYNAGTQPFTYYAQEIATIAFRLAFSFVFGMSFFALNPANGVEPALPVSS
jgi:hypothetical protein